MVPSTSNRFQRKKVPLHIPLVEFVPWTAAHFLTEAGRDRFLAAVATQQTTEVEVLPMPDESRGALVRWLPGKFLGLNDVAYAHGGRIVLPEMHRYRA